MFSLIVFVVILSALIFIHELGHFIAARRVGVRVERFSLGFGPRLWGIKRGDTIYQISAIPLGGYIKMAGDNPDECRGKKYEYLSQPPKNKAQVILAGSAMNYILGMVCFCPALTLGIPDSSSLVGEVMAGYPAQAAGVRTGDKIVSVDGKDVKHWVELLQLIHDKRGQAVDISILRNDQRLNMRLKTKIEKIATPQGEREISLIGIKQAQKRYPAYRAFTQGVGEYIVATGRYYQVLGMMAVGKVSLRRSVAGPIGIFYITSGAASIGLGMLLYVLAMLNLGLSVFNLLPFPVLDGGHFALISLEQVRGKRISRRSEVIIERLGIIALIALSLFVTYNDVINFGIWSKIKEWFLALVARLR
ncbi:MAG: RIP metalloprotease [Candidatus Omnitrophota bacterium]